MVGVGGDVEDGAGTSGGIDAVDGEGALAGDDVVDLVLAVWGLAVDATGGEDVEAQAQVRNAEELVPRFTGRLTGGGDGGQIEGGQGRRLRTVPSGCSFSNE